MTTNEPFVKEEFLAKALYSIGLSTGFPDSKRGCRCVKGRNIWMLRFSEQSLLELRDQILSPDRIQSSLGETGTSIIVESIRSRFYWMLDPNYDEILSWTNPSGLRLVQKALSSWYHRSVTDDCHVFADKRKRCLHTAAIAVLAELLERLPGYTYANLLSWN